MRKYGESKTTRIMMATVPHVTSGLGLRRFQANGFLLTRVYLLSPQTCRIYQNVRQLCTYDYPYHSLIGTKMSIQNMFDFLCEYNNNMVIDCKWVDTRWQWSFNMLHMHGLWRLII